MIARILTSCTSVIAREISCLTGTLVYMELALGPVVRLRTRSLYADQNCVANLSACISVSSDSISKFAVEDCRATESVESRSYTGSLSWSR